MQSLLISVCVFFVILNTLDAQLTDSANNTTCPCECLSFLASVQADVASCGTGVTKGCVMTMCELGSQNGLTCCQPSKGDALPRASTSPSSSPSPVTPSPSPSSKDFYRASLYVAAPYATVFINGMSFSATRWGALHALVPKLAFGDVITMIARGGRVAAVLELNGLTFLTGTDDFRVAIPFGAGEENSTWMMPGYDQGCGWHPASVTSVNHTLPAYPAGKGAQNIWFSEAPERSEIFVRYKVGASPCPEGSEAAGFDDGIGKYPLPSAEVSAPPFHDNDSPTARIDENDELALWRRTVLEKLKETKSKQEAKS